MTGMGLNRIGRVSAEPTVQVVATLELIDSELIAPARSNGVSFVEPTDAAFKHRYRAEGMRFGWCGSSYWGAAVRTVKPSANQCVGAK